MAKQLSNFICQDCGYKTNRWMGQCSRCKKWNSFEEFHEENEVELAAMPETKTLKELGNLNRKKISSGYAELDSVLGGGFVPGSLVLIGGEPGIGKSTLLMQLSNNIDNVIYVSGEESLSQLAERAKRLNIEATSGHIINENNINSILKLLKSKKPDVVIIDSIQTVHKGDMFAGSIAQIRESTQSLLEYAKKSNCVIIISGHITKEGAIAGPKQLEHAVDLVMYMEQGAIGNYRVIRSIKNRFGRSGDVAVFQMQEKGLLPLAPENWLDISESSGGVGCVLFPQIEGSRVMMCEVQVLVSPSGISTGRRIGERIDTARIHLASAILQKFLFYKLSQCDIFVRVRGNTHLSEAAGDLALIIAMASSYCEKAFSKLIVAAGEVSLSGRIHEPPLLKERLELLNKLKLNANFYWGGEEASNSTKVSSKELNSSVFIADVKTSLVDLFGD